MPRVPRDAFDQYVAMGAGATYAGLAKRLGVSKRSIVRRAIQERWQERLADIENVARKRTDEKLAESIEAINTRHLKVLRAIQAKALQGLASLPMKTGSDCVRALVLSINAERGVIGKAAEPEESAWQTAMMGAFQQGQRRRQGEDETDDAD